MSSSVVIYTVITRDMPFLRTYETFWAGASPGSNPSDGSSVYLAMRFRFEVDGWLLGVLTWREFDANHTQFAYVQNDSTGEFLRAVVFPYHDPNTWGPGWQTRYLQPRLRVNAGDILLIGAFYQQGGYRRSLHYTDSGDVTHGNITLVGDSGGNHNGRFTYDGDLVAQYFFLGSAYSIDVLFTSEL